MSASLTAVARRLSFVRETLGPNRGYWVSAFQRFAGGVDGESWCADFVSFVLDVAYAGRSPLRKTGSTRHMLDEARTKGFVVPTPTPDCLFFYVNADGVPHHVGIVTSVATGPGGLVVGIAGNTSEDGQSSNGTGVFEHAIMTARTVYAVLP